MIVVSTLRYYAHWSSRETCNKELVRERTCHVCRPQHDFNDSMNRGILAVACVDGSTTSMVPIIYHFRQLNEIILENCIVYIVLCSIIIMLRPLTVMELEGSW